MSTDLFPLRLGGVTIHRIEEQVLLIPSGDFFKSEATVASERATGERGGWGPPEGLGKSPEGLAVAKQVQSVEWLHPMYLDERGDITLVFQMYVIDTPGGKRIAVDTCGGNDKHRPDTPSGHMQSRPFIDDLRAAGCDPESVDFVLCTHLHWDHVGFNTILRDGVWVPTFPKARYLFARREMEHFERLAADKADKEHHEDVYRDSVRPIIDAGLHELVDSDHVLVDEPDCRIRLTPSEGHSAGHVSIVVESGGQAGYITGDCIHHPVQLAHPSLGTYYDYDSPAAADTRVSLLDAAAEKGHLLVGTHFAQPSAGYVEKLGEACYRLRPAVNAPKL